MKFTQTEIPGVFIIDIEPVTDERGMFARCWCKEEFSKLGLSTDLSQCSFSFNKKKATLRGMHYQKAPHTETKVIRCTRGSIYDVVIDLRPDSAAYKRWFSVLLSADNHRLLYVPEGLAHGLITLEPDTEIFYQISVPYAPQSAAGVRWDDPAFKIDWPMAPEMISEKDTSYPNF